ncbi:MAG: Serine/threonine protein kinase PrkC, regulator of stationary phase [Myxococcales bacterium]|nr:Serine/threonine protein kinase PrkC, regulator of stationary phase [Myxococcales bacterium]
MAEVFLAKRPGPEGFEKRVALKRILPHLAKQTDFVDMFLDEARLAASLDHPHIVHIHDFGVDGGAYYLAMEYVCGEDLAAMFRRAKELGAPMPLVDVVTILVSACEALHHAHERGIVHRDVTPANLIVSYDGAVKLADFGIAKSQAVASRSHTNAGTLKGKIPYMSPEQARATPLDRRSDLFSLGVVAWELLTGKRLFHRRNELDMLRAVQMCDVPSLRTVRKDIPLPLAAAIETALAPDAEQRFESAAEMGQALSAWLASTGESPSKVHLTATMARLFGDDAARRRLAAVNTPSEQTEANIALPPDEPSEPRLWPLRPERWIPQIAMQLHLPPPKMPPLRMVGPLMALLLSLGGLLYGLKSPHAHRALVGAGLLAPAATTATATSPATAPVMPPVGASPVLVPRKLRLDLTPPTLQPPLPPSRDLHGKSRRHDRQRRKYPTGV